MIINKQSILALSLAMEKIERRNPQTYRKNAKWIKMNNLREQISICLAKIQCDYHKDRYKRTNDVSSAVKSKQYQDYISKYESKGENNENKQLWPKWMVKHYWCSQR